MASPTVSLPGRQVWCHREFLDELKQLGDVPVARRAKMFLRRLADPEFAPPARRAPAGAHDWFLTRIDGQELCWATPESGGPVFVRHLRRAGAAVPPDLPGQQEYLLCGPSDLRSDASLLPWTEVQESFAASTQRLRVLRGNPGSGKTAALLEAAMRASFQRILLVTFSDRLVAQAKTVFRSLLPSHRFHAITFGQFLGNLCGRCVSEEQRQGARLRFEETMRRRFAAHLGPWEDNAAALYEELHARMAGRGEFGDGRLRARLHRLADTSYQAEREHELGGPAVDRLLQIVHKIEEESETGLAAQFFPHLELAWEAAAALEDPSDSVLHDALQYDCIVVDEVQDLTWIEVLVLIEYARLIKARLFAPFFLAAGDETQTVHPTHFRWGWFHDLLRARLEAAPQSFALELNLRSAPEIVQLVNRSGSLYRTELEKRYRPGDAHPAQTETGPRAAHRILHCLVPPNLLQEATGLAASRRGATVVRMNGDAGPGALTTAQVKGLDLRCVCLLNPSEQLARIHALGGGGSPLAAIRQRWAIDSLRIGVSRAREELLLVDAGESNGYLDEWLADLPVERLSAAEFLEWLNTDEVPLAERLAALVEDARQLLETQPAAALEKAERALGLLEAEPPAARELHPGQIAQARMVFAHICLRAALEERAPGALLDDGRERALEVGQVDLVDLFAALKRVQEAPAGRRIEPLAWLLDQIVRARDLDSYTLSMLESHCSPWLAELEAAAEGSSGPELLPVLEMAYDRLSVRNRKERLEELRQKVVNLLMGSQRHAEARDLLLLMQSPSPLQLALCCEELGEYAEAGRMYRRAGLDESALRNFRLAGEISKALEIMKPTDPASPSLAWTEMLLEHLSRMPEDLEQRLTPAELEKVRAALPPFLGSGADAEPTVRRFRLLFERAMREAVEKA